MQSQVAVATEGRSDGRSDGHARSQGPTHENRDQRAGHDGYERPENGREAAQQHGHERGYERGYENDTLRASVRATPVTTRPLHEAPLPAPDALPADTPASANGGNGGNGPGRVRGWRAVPPRPLREPGRGDTRPARIAVTEAPSPRPQHEPTQHEPTQHEPGATADTLPPAAQPASSGETSVEAHLAGVPVVPVRSSDARSAPARDSQDARQHARVTEVGRPEGGPHGAPVTAAMPTASPVATGSSAIPGDEEEYAELTVPLRAIEPAPTAPRPEVRGEFGPLIDSLRDLFAHDRAIASAGNSARCGLCYLHHPLAELDYREEEGYYVCPACKHSLGSARLPMVRRQQRAGR